MAGKTAKRVQKGITSDQVHEVIRLIQEEGMSENGATKKVGVNRITFRSAVLKENLVSDYAKAYEALATDQIDKIDQAIADMRDGVIDSSMARVEIDTRKWFASKFLPRRYGDKMDVTTGGEKLPTPLLGGLASHIIPSSEIIDVESSAQ